MDLVSVSMVKFFNDAFKRRMEQLFYIYYRTLGIGPDPWHVIFARTYLSWLIEEHGIVATY